MEPLANAILPVDELIQDDDDILRFRNLTTDEVITKIYN